MKKSSGKWLAGGIVVVALVVGGIALSHHNANSQTASVFNIQKAATPILATGSPLTPADGTPVQAGTLNRVPGNPVPQPQPHGVCALTITALPTPASQNVPVGTTQFDFAHIQFAASTGCAITLNKVVVGVNDHVTSVPAMIQNLKAFNLATGVQVGSTIASPTWANIIGTNLGIQIPAGGSVTLALKADAVGVGATTIQLGESYTEAVQTGTTTQVGNGYQYWGQWMTIINSNTCVHGTICYINGSNTNTVFSFNPSTSIWSQVAAAAQWSPRDGEQINSFNGKLWMMGGYTGGGSYIGNNDVWSSSNGGVTWTQVTAHAPWSARAQFQSVVFNNKLWVMGGTPGAGWTSYLNDVWSSSDGVSWTEATAHAPWSVRSDFQAVVFNNKIWVIGGSALGSNGYEGSNDVWSSSDGVNWTEATANAPWSPRGGFQSVAFNNKLWVMGGDENNIAYNDVWSSPDGVTWTQVTANAAWSPRFDFASVVLNNKLWVMGGDGNNGPQISDLWSSSDGLNWTQVTAHAPWLGSWDGGAVAP